jgi:hypothetical protein
LAFPFAAHFVLPDERNWWISQTRLEMEAPSVVLRALSPEVPADFYDLSPGDFVENGMVCASARQAPEPQAARSSVLGHYGSPPERPVLGQSAFHQLVADIRARVAPRQIPANFDALIVLTDFEPQAIRLYATPDGPGVEALDRPITHHEPPQVIMETRSDLVRSTLRSPFGKDLISIGYGAQFTVRSAADLDAAPHDRLVQLLSPTPPRWRQQLRERPWRTLRYLLGDPSMRYAAAQPLLRHSRNTIHQPAPYEMRDWVAAPEA